MLGFKKKKEQGSTQGAQQGGFRLGMKRQAQGTVAQNEQPMVPAGGYVKQTVAASRQAGQAASVINFLQSSMLKYNDFSEDYEFIGWIEDNISDPDVEPLVSIEANHKIFNFTESIRRVQQNFNDEVPDDFIDDSQLSSDNATRGNSGEVEVNIL